MKALKIYLIAILVIFMSACAVKPPTTSDYDTSFDFTHLKTYAWIVPSDDKVSTLENKRLENAIETMLNRKGFSKVAVTGKADFLLTTHTVTDKKVDVDRFYSTWGYYPFYNPNFGYPPFYGWPQNSTTVVREQKIGTLVLDIVDPVKKQVIWRGTLARPLDIYKDRTPEERSSFALADAEYLLQSFPPPPIAVN